MVSNLTTSCDAVTSRCSWFSSVAASSFGSGLPDSWAPKETKISSKTSIKSRVTLSSEFNRRFRRALFAVDLFVASTRSVFVNSVVPCIAARICHTQSTSSARVSRILSISRCRYAVPTVARICLFAISVCASICRFAVERAVSLWMFATSRLAAVCRFDALRPTYTAAKGEINAAMATIASLCSSSARIADKMEFMSVP